MKPSIGFEKACNYIQWGREHHLVKNAAVLANKFL